MRKVADAIRKVTATMKEAIEAGQRSRHVDADDLIEVLSAVAELIDPEYGDAVSPQSACPGCGESRPDHLAWQDDERVRCAACGMEYIPQP